ncbi:MAG: hypothetical protein Unbinned1520contig1002_46 [Prokaryotic dsDNA virus sp.]|nr:MAG: hypothetical protein Unbinned1520contig1002_46 [Prokaryotic dsDNA virus sp.]|tara:strand:+ start:12562 stop:12867 length:306 start_codon:yes stop_codon:yes gene_type:complete
MKEIDELKKQAAPKHFEMIERLENQIKEQVITNNLLCQLCDLKEAQQAHDNSFRSAWRNAKVRDTKVSLWVLVLANVALYLDVIKIDSNGTFITGLIGLFS